MLHVLYTLYIVRLVVTPLTHTNYKYEGNLTGDQK